MWFSDVNSDDGDVKFATSHIPFPSSDIGTTVQGWYYCRGRIMYPVTVVLLILIKGVWLRKEKQVCLGLLWLLSSWPTPK